MRRCNYNHPLFFKPESNFFINYAFVLFMLPLASQVVYIIVLRNVQEKFRSRLPSFIFTLVYFIYTLSVYPVYMWGDSVWSRVVQHGTELVMNTSVFWLFAGPALYEVYKDKDRDERVRQARVREEELKDKHHRTGSGNSQSRELNDLNDLAAEGLIALAQVKVKREIFDDQSLPALSQARAVQYGLVPHFVENGLMLHAMSELLCTPVGTSAFETFLRRESAEENVKFLRACNAYIALSQRPMARLCEDGAQSLRDAFFTAGAENELSVPGRIADGISEQVNAGRSAMTTFDEARFQILKLLASDSFPRFVVSAEYEHCMAELERQSDTKTMFDREMDLQGGAAAAALTVEPVLAAERFRMRQAKKENIDTNIALVIVGTGGSGKSTVVKQFRAHFGSPYNIIERRTWASRIRSNILSDLLLCARRAQRRVGQPGAPAVDQALIDALVAAPLGSIAEQVSAIKKALASSAVGCRCNDSIEHFSAQMPYFHDHMDRIATEDYSASDQDILYCPSSTLGVTTYDFNANGTEFHVVDCGGQRSQRRKWLRFFSEATAVLFVSSLDDYWHAQSGDEQRNKLRESIETFAETINSKALQDRCVCLFLNKTDLLEDSLKTRPFRRFFPSFDADKDAENPEHVIAFVKGLFEACNKSTRRARQLFVTATCVGNKQSSVDLAATIKRAVMDDVAKEGGL